jgi:hypothetical protein
MTAQHFNIFSLSSFSITEGSFFTIGFLGKLRSIIYRRKKKKKQNISEKGIKSFQDRSA